MKITLLTVLGLVLLVGIQLAAEPKLDIDYKEYDFGWVPLNSVGVRYFVIRSIGDDTLVINDISTSSRGLTIPLAKQMLAPGDTMIIPAVWHFDDTPNRVSQYAQIFTNEPSVLNGKPHLIQFKAIIVTNPETLQPVASKPYRVEFSRMANVDIDSVEFTLTNVSKRDLDLTVTSYPYLECQISVPDSLGPETSKTGWIKLNPEYRDTDFLSSLTIRMTDNLNYDRSLTIPVRRKSYTP